MTAVRWCDGERQSHLLFHDVAGEECSGSNLLVVASHHHTRLSHYRVVTAGRPPPDEDARIGV